MDPKISKESPDGGGRDSGARPDPPDCHGTRDYDLVGKSLLRPHSRLDRPPAARGCEYDRAMAEGHQFADTPSGVSALAESVLGAALLGEGISGGEYGDIDGRDGQGVHRGTRGRARAR